MMLIYKCAFEYTFSSLHSLICTMYFPDNSGQRDCSFQIVLSREHTRLSTKNRLWLCNHTSHQCPHRWPFTLLGGEIECLDNYCYLQVYLCMLSVLGEDRSPEWLPTDRYLYLQCCGTQHSWDYYVVHHGRTDGLRLRHHHGIPSGWNQYHTASYLHT